MLTVLQRNLRPIVARRPAKPFLGVCGIQSPNDFTELLQRTAHLIGGTHYIMAGVKQPLAAVVPALPDLLRPFVHCDYSHAERFDHTVHRNVRLTSKYVRGLQLNMLPWMDVDYAPLWRRLKQDYPGLLLMLQAHGQIMDNYSPYEVARAVRHLEIDYLLLDSSQSRGIAFNVGQIETYVRAILRENPSLGLVVAGGLSGQTLGPLFGPLINKYPALSCDAFGLLQHSDTAKLDWLAVESYLNAWKNCTPAI